MSWADYMRKYWEVVPHMIDVLDAAEEPLTSKEITKRVEAVVGYQFDSDWTIGWLGEWLDSHDVDGWFDSRKNGIVYQLL